MSNQEVVPVVVNILEREYRITCPVGEEEALQAAACHLDERMKEVKTNGKVVGTDRIAVMVALNVTHELMALSPEHGLPYDNISSRLKSLQEKVDLALDCK